MTQPNTDNPSPRHGFLGQVLTLFTGEGIALAITIAATPILTRLYTPEDWGLVGLFIAVSMLVASIACLRYEQAIVLANDDDEAVNTFGLALSLALIISLLAFVALLLLGPILANTLNQPQLAHWLPYAPIVLISFGLAQALRYWNIRRKQFRSLALAATANASMRAITQLLIALLIAPLAAGLVGGVLAGHVAAALILILAVTLPPRLLKLSRLRIPSMLAMAQRHKKFALFSTPSILLGNAVTYLPIVLLGYFFDASIVGLYTLANRLAYIPIRLASVSIGQAFYARGVEAYRKGDLDQVMFRIWDRLLTLGILPMLFICLTGPSLTALVLGPQWLQSGLYLRLLTPWLFLVLISAPLAQVLAIVEKQQYSLFFNLLFAVTVVAGVVLGGIFDNDLLAIGLMGAVGCLGRLLYCITVLHVAGIRPAHALRQLLRELIMILPYLALLAGARWLLGNAGLYVLASALITAGFLAFRLKHWWRNRKDTTTTVTPPTAL